MKSRAVRWVFWGLLAMPMAVIAEEKLEYNRDIRPILFENCFACHGADSASRKGDLRLDQRDAALEMQAIVPGNVEESALIQRILSEEPEEVMPPPATKKSLTSEQKEILKRWVSQGAEYQPHWSFIAPVRPVPPAVQNSGWVKNPIDSFVLSRLEQEGLTPAEEADRRTLARRVSLDLRGLPPAPEMVEAFVNDPAPNAYEKLVDQLLESESWGEHRARYWLDYARYADTHGIHFDNFREMWTYREWVIQAFNKNMPYDQFTIESLAGDLLPNPTQDQLIGSGFNRCNMTTNEGGIIDEEYLVLYARDRTESTGQVWMGLTVGCAVCHSHKFDPVSQKEFYELAAFFNNTTQAARDGNVQNTPPIIVVPKEEDEARWEELKSQIATSQKAIESRRGEARAVFNEWIAKTTPSELLESLPTSELAFEAAFKEGEGNKTTVRIDGNDREVELAASATRKPGPHAGTNSVELQGGAAEFPEVGDFEANQAFSVSTWIKAPANDGHGAVCARMENEKAFQGWDVMIQQRRVAMHLVNAWPDKALKVVAKPQLKANEWVHVTVTYDGSGKAAGVKIYYDGKPQGTNVEADKLTDSTKTGVPFKIGQRNTSEQIAATAIHDLRIYKRLLNDGEAETLARVTRFAGILEKPADQRSEGEVNELYDWWLTTKDELFQNLTKTLATQEREQSDIKTRGTIAHVMQEKNDPAMAYVLFRGDYDKRRDEVRPETPKFLPPMASEEPKNRLGFAKWLLQGDHPLTSRVTVNRYWQEVFGTGIVRTTGDFGISGELPSDQKLLDWLAVEFRETGWDVKRLFKLMVMSSTYQQSATATPEKLKKDPQNRLLARGPRFRMDGEMVRDYALASSGLLVSKIGGPSVKPYQPPGVWEAIAMDVSNTKAYTPDTGEGLYRRSLYTFWKRMAPPASLDLFNAPSREFCVVRRERTNTPIQALVTLNDEQFIEAARYLAQTALQQGGTFEDRIKLVGLRVLAREFRPDEVTIIKASLKELMNHYNAHSDEAAQVIKYGASKADEKLPTAELAAWTMLCNELMNLDEVLNK